MFRPEEGGTRPCGAYPIRGGTVCPVHGGMAPQTQAAAARVLAEREAVAQAQQLYPRRRPSEILLDALHKYDALAQQAAAEGWADAGVLGQRASNLAQIALNKDLEAVEDRVTEDIGNQLAQTVRRILDRLDLTSEQLQLVPAVVSEEFRAAAVPESGSVRTAVDALLRGVDARLAERQALIVVDAWQRAVGTLGLDEPALDRVTAVFVHACRIGAEQRDQEHQATEPVA